VLELREPAGTGPRRGGLAQALACGLPSTRQLLESFVPLAQNVAAAHRHGLPLGCAHPSRIRRADDGRLEMAVAPIPRAATLEQDVQGLGAILYALLTGFWPLPASDAELGGLPRAPRDRSGTVVAPILLRHGLAPELSALAMAALGAGVDRSHARVRTAAAIGRVADDLRTEWACEVLPPREDTAVGQSELWHADGGAAAGRDPVTARKLSAGMAGLGLGTMVVLCLLAYQAAAMLGIGPPSAPRVVVVPGQAQAAAMPDIPLTGLPPVFMALAAPPNSAPPTPAVSPILGLLAGALPIAGPPAAAPPPASAPPTSRVGTRSTRGTGPAVRQSDRQSESSGDSGQSDSGQSDSGDSDTGQSDSSRSKDRKSHDKKAKKDKRRASQDE